MENIKPVTNLYKMLNPPKSLFKVTPVVGGYAVHAPDGRLLFKTPSRKRANLFRDSYHKDASKVKDLGWVSCLEALPELNKPVLAYGALPDKTRAYRLAVRKDSQRWVNYPNPMDDSLAIFYWKYFDTTTLEALASSAPTAEGIEEHF